MDWKLARSFVGKVGALVLKIVRHHSTGQSITMTTTYSWNPQIIYVRAILELPERVRFSVHGP